MQNAITLHFNRKNHIIFITKHTTTHLGHKLHFPVVCYRQSPIL